MPGSWTLVATSQGDLAVHDSKGAQVNAQRAHEGGAVAVCMLPQADSAVATGGEAVADADRQQGAGSLVLSAGQDCTAKVWRVSDSGTLSPILRCGSPATT